jgi:serine-type D-Ala-D-Ala carboxypeptidase (penicillin-binding protein 5/6)
VGLALLGIVVTGGVLLVLMASRGSEPSGGGAATAVTPRPVHHPPHRADYAIELAPAPEQVRHGPKGALRSGMLFDVRTGRVLWERDPTRALPIASLTKMMTALVVVAHAKPSAHVLITRQATRFTGSGVGLLPRGKRVPLRPLLYGLLLPSGNDAATALAQHVAGTQARFVAMMNARARQMGLGCTHYTTVSGIVDRGNHSCPSDLAVLAHAMLKNKLLAKIVATRSAILPFPIKAHRLFLYNNNPLMLARYPGIDGVKTGFTTASGLCIVATARRGHSWLGVVLLHSVNWSDQAEQLLNAGFAKLRRS